MSDIEILSEILNEIKAIKEDVKERFDTLESKVDALEQDVKRNTIVTGSTINQCIKVLGDGWSLNAERLDRFDVDTIKSIADQAFMMSKLVNEKVDKLSEKIEKVG